MMRNIFIFLIVLFSFSVPVLAGDFTKESLLTSWEEIQKNDPQTVRFEKLGDGLYEFETARFPYKGKLRVLNLALNDSGDEYGEFGGGMLQGAVEVELADAPEDFIKRHSTSYYWWSRGNTLSFDESSQSWLTPAGYRKSLEQQQAAYQNVSARSGCWVNKGLYIALGLFLLVLFTFVVLARRAGMKNYKQMMDRQARILEIAEENLQINKDSQTLFKKILTQLEKIAQSS